MIPVTSFGGKKVAVFGLGASGLASASALFAGGADVVGWDDHAERIAHATKAGIPTADLRETDWSKIEKRIQVADNAIKVRLHEFSMNHGGTPEENQAIEDALNGLNFLRKDVAAWQKRVS